MKKAFKIFIHNWYAYLLSLIAFTFILNYVVDFIDMPRNEETFTIFVASQEYELPKLAEKLAENKPSYLRQLVVASTNINDEVHYNKTFLVYGMDNSDVVILPKSKIDDTKVMRYYASFTDEYISTYIESSSYYVCEEDNRNYGMLVHSVGQDNNDLITYSTEEFDEDYYAFFIKKSKHIGELNHTDYVTAFTYVNIIKNN